MVDNCSDNYHVPTSHLSSARVQSRWLGRPRLSHEDQFASPNKHAFVNGHSITFRDADDNAPRYMHGVSSETMHLFQEYHAATMPEVQTSRWKLCQPTPSSRNATSAAAMCTR